MRPPHYIVTKENLPLLDLILLLTRLDVHIIEYNISELENAVDAIKWGYSNKRPPKEYHL